MRLISLTKQKKTSLHRKTNNRQPQRKLPYRQSPPIQHRLRKTSRQHRLLRCSKAQFPVSIQITHRRNSIRSKTARMSTIPTLPTVKIMHKTIIIPTDIITKIPMHLTAAIPHQCLLSNRQNLPTALQEPWVMLSECRCACSLS